VITVVSAGTGMTGGPAKIIAGASGCRDNKSALEEQRNGEWRYLELLQATSWITADIFMPEIPGGTRARHRSRPVDLPEHRY